LGVEGAARGVSAGIRDAFAAAILSATGPAEVLAVLRAPLFDPERAFSSTAFVEK
jgi:hypothetical protein